MPSPEALAAANCLNPIKDDAESLNPNSPLEGSPIYSESVSWACMYCHHNVVHGFSPYPNLTAHCNFSFRFGRERTMKAGSLSHLDQRRRPASSSSSPSSSPFAFLSHSPPPSPPRSPPALKCCPPTPSPAIERKGQTQDMGFVGGSIVCTPAQSVASY